MGFCLNINNVGKIIIGKVNKKKYKISKFLFTWSSRRKQPKSLHFLKQNSKIYL